MKRILNKIQGSNFILRALINFKPHFVINPFSLILQKSLKHFLQSPETLLQRWNSSFSYKQEDEKKTQGFFLSTFICQ